MVLAQKTVKIEKNWTKKKAKRNADGDVILSITDDFTNCGTRVEAVTEVQVDESGAENQVVTEYAVSTSIFAELHSFLDKLEFNCWIIQNLFCRTRYFPN